MKFPNSIRAINDLPDSEKLEVYNTLIPSWLAERVPPSTVRIRCPHASRSVEIAVKRNAYDTDSILYLNMVDTLNNQLLVLLVVVNDPDTPRFNIDIDNEGNSTGLGTITRNRDAELKALQHGLAPGQVRQGLRQFGTLVSLFETFVKRMGHELYFIEPLSYHNAVVFERYGFGYLRGASRMRHIHQMFQPDGYLHQLLDDDKPFRKKMFWRSIRGRSWAIHDGILGKPFTGFQMYKRVDQSVDICTFPDAIW